MIFHDGKKIHCSWRSGRGWRKVVREATLTSGSVRQNAAWAMWDDTGDVEDHHNDNDDHNGNRDFSRG